MITKEIAKTLSYRTELQHKMLRDSRGKPIRCRVNGAIKTWKTRPSEWLLPVKHGLKRCFYISPDNASEWALLS